MDVLDELAEIPVCVGYKLDGKPTTEAPAQASGYERLECIYTKMPGWRTPTQGITQIDQLPKTAREYLKFLEKETGAKIGMVSTGPGREQTMYADDFLASLKSGAKT